MAKPEMGQPRTLRDGWALFGLLVLAASLRAFAWHQTAVIFNDGPVFLAMAEAIQAGRWAEILAHPYHPLYPALVALVARAPVALETAAVGVSIAGGLLAILAVFFFVRRAFDRDLAWLAAWTVALHPWAVDFSSDVMSDGLYAGLYLAGFATLAAAVERPRISLALVGGAVAGLAYLTRPEGVGLLVVAGVLFAVCAIRNRECRGPGLAAFAAVAIAAACLMAPYIYSVANETGEWTLSSKKSLTGLAMGGSPSATLGRSSLRLPERGAAPLPLPRSSERVDGGGASRPSRTIAGFMSAISRAARTSLASLRYEIALMVVFGLWAMGSRRRFLREATLVVPVVLYTGVLVLLVWGAGYVARRHALAALLPLVAYAAFGWRVLHRSSVAWLGHRRPEWIPFLNQRQLLCVGLVLVLSISWGARDLRPRRADRSAIRAAAEWLAAEGRPEVDLDAPVVAAQKLRIAYYAGARFVPLPSGLNSSIETVLRRRGVRWVVIDEDGLTEHRGLAAGVGTWLRLAHAVEQAGNRALVLEMRTPPAP